MKTKTVYMCDFCNKEYNRSIDAYKCEAEHLGLTIDEYKEYMNLLEEERRAFSAASSVVNNEIRKRCDDTIKAVFDFQKEHNFTDNR